MNVLRFFISPGSGQPEDEGAAVARRRPLVLLAREVFAEYFAILRWGGEAQGEGRAQAVGLEVRWRLRSSQSTLPSPGGASVE